jgi:hypothetical protein
MRVCCLCGMSRTEDDDAHLCTAEVVSLLNKASTAAA